MKLNETHVHELKQQTSNSINTGSCEQLELTQNQMTLAFNNHKTDLSLFSAPKAGVNLMGPTLL